MAKKKTKKKPVKKKKIYLLITILLKVLTSEKLRNSDLTTNKYLTYIYSKMKVES